MSQRLGIEMVQTLPDGLDIEIIQLCRYGAPGERKTLSYSTAMQLIIRGYAVIYKPAAVTSSTPLPARVIRSPLVTAICPTYNRRKYLPTSIALFLKQTFTDSELLIVDDSTESIEDLVPKHPRIRYVRLSSSVENRLLIGEKRNICCAEARGEFIVHWDDDDWQAPDRIADQVFQLRHHGKQVLTYCNILYYRESDGLVCRCFPSKGLWALHGATFCYRKSWWEKHRFPNVGGGEDTAFGTQARSAQQLLLTDAGKRIVTRAHGNVETLDDRGNTCWTATHMGQGAIPKTNISEIPREFFDTLLASVPEELLKSSVSESEDAVIGVIKNYGWAQIAPYAVSLSRCGFAGAKLMFVENIRTDARMNLNALGFTVIDFSTPASVLLEERRDYLTFGRHRFKPVIDYLKANPGRFRNIVWCDVRDLIFQADPCEWLRNNMPAQCRIVAAGEGWRVKDEPDGYNDRWTRTVSPNDYAHLREEEVLCSGTIAGDAAAMLDVFERIYEMTIKSLNVAPGNADQAMFQRIVRTAPYDAITFIPRYRDGFCATWFPAKNTDTAVIPNYGLPVFSIQDVTLYAPESGKPFCIVHAYDRDAQWRMLIHEKYRLETKC